MSSKRHRSITGIPPVEKLIILPESMLPAVQECLIRKSSRQYVGTTAELPEKPLEAGNLSDDRKYFIYNQNLQKTLKRKDIARKRLTNVIAKSFGQDSDDDTESDSDDVKPNRTDVEIRKVVDLLPKKYREKSEQILRTFKNNSDIADWNKRSEIMYLHKTVSGSNIVDLLHIAMAQSKNINVIGMGEFINAFRQINAPVTLLANRKMKEIIRNPMLTLDSSKHGRKPIDTTADGNDQRGSGFSSRSRNGKSREWIYF